MIPERRGMLGEVGTSIGIALVALLAVLAIYTGYQSLVDVSHREAAPADRDYLAQRRTRRAIASAVMLATATAMGIGILLNPGRGIEAGIAWSASWLVVMTGAILLLTLAFRDWGATRRYGRERLAAIRREREKFLEEAIGPDEPLDDEHGPFDGYPPHLLN
jgi:hypothetical protein